MKLKEVLDEMLNEVAIDQLRTQYVDSGKMPSTVFDKVIDAANKKSAYATWLAKRVLTRVSIKTILMFLTAIKENTLLLTLIFIRTQTK